MNKNITKVEQNKMVDKVVLKFTDGTEKVINKGVFISKPENLASGELSLNFVNMTGKDVLRFFNYMFQASAELLGIF